MPKHIPKNGFLLSRQNFAASILPSTPRLPKPPGITTPLALRMESHASLYRAGLASYMRAVDTNADFFLPLMRIQHAVLHNNSRNKDVDIMGCWCK